MISDCLTKTKTMFGDIRTYIALLCCVLSVVKVSGLINDPQAIQIFLTEYNTQAEIEYYTNTEATWTFYTNITDYNQKLMLDAEMKVNKFAQGISRNASQYDLSSMSPSDRRQFIKIMDIGTAAQTNETKLARLSKLVSDMESIYSTAKVCLNSTYCAPLEPDLTELLEESRDYNLLAKAWKLWRDATGKKMKALYAEFVTLSNEAVKILGYADTGAYWRSWYDTPTFEDDVRALYDQLRPLYEHLHAYTRRKLKGIYGNDKFPSSGHIPAQLLGNMWAQQWDGLIHELTPFPDKSNFDVTDEMVKQNYTAKKIFETADEFFKSLGMIAMPFEFWNKSMLEKPTDGREVVCHASAWDFSNRKDFRIKQCTVVNMRDLETAHHEMGHIEYYLQYANQPIAFRAGANPGQRLVENSFFDPVNIFRILNCAAVTQHDLIVAHHEVGHIAYNMAYKEQPIKFRSGGNPGFHEAVGDVISLSVQTPEHMHKIGLLKTLSNDTESDINFLMSMALQKIAFLPFGYLIDQWRWKVFRGETTPDKYNEEWWNLRCRYQGVSPPVERSSDDFDPGAKYHIPANVPYIRYFVSFVIQFQFHKALCDASGYIGPLHRCDIYNNKEAGKKLSDMLKLGSSKPWTEAMQLITGQPKMDAQPLMEYFKPLLEHLRRENDNDYGWQPHCPSLTSPPTTAPPKKFCTDSVSIVESSELLLILLLSISLVNFY